MTINYFFNKNIAIILVSFLLALTPVSSFSFQLDKGLIDYDVLFKEGLKRSGKILNLSGKKIGDRGIEHLVSSKYLGKVEKIDLHNFFHFVKLRADSHAQREIRDYANAMYELVKPRFPLCCEAFEDYSRDAVTFSKHEMEIIKDNLNNIVATDRLSKREETEFLEKLK